MKRTNTFLSTFWVKAIPVFLLLIGIGFTNANAQNYKPLGEAFSSVSTALDALKAENVGRTVSQGSSGATQLGGKTTSQPVSKQLIVFETGYYDRFLELAKLNNNVAIAVEQLDVQFPLNQAPPRNATVTSARSDLMHLITY